MTDSDLTKYDWRRKLGDGGSGYCHQHCHRSINTEACLDTCAYRRDCGGRFLEARGNVSVAWMDGQSPDAR